MNITFHINAPVTPEEAAELYRAAELRRPVDDLDRIQRMYTHSNLVVCARQGDRLVGVARALTDFSYCCYLSDLAVHPDFQGQGLGRELIARVRAEAGPEALLLLLAAPNAMTYYPHIGMEHTANAFYFRREY